MSARKGEALGITIELTAEIKVHYDWNMKKGHSKESLGIQDQCMHDFCQPYTVHNSVKGNNERNDVIKLAYRKVALR